MQRADSQQDAISAAFPGWRGGLRTVILCCVLPALLGGGMALASLWVMRATSLPEEGLASDLIYYGLFAFGILAGGKVGRQQLQAAARRKLDRFDL